MWTDALCTTKPSVPTDTLYVRFEEAFGFGDEHFWGGYANPDEMLFIFTPTEEAPTETYQVRAYRNFLSEEQTELFHAGSVVKLVNVLGKVETEGFKTEFLW